MERADFTLNILAQELRGRRGVHDLMADLEARVSEAYAGQALSWDMRPGILALAEAVIPAPACYRWEIELKAGDQAQLYLERSGGLPDGYRFAARVITGFDGGSHPLRGDLWACKRCGSAVIPDDCQAHDRHHAEVDELRALLARAA